MPGSGHRDDDVAKSDSDVLIRVVDLVKTYALGSAPVHALRGVSVEIRRGERIALLGRSGSGKSTLLNVLVSSFTENQAILFTAIGQAFGCSVQWANERPVC